MATEVGLPPSDEGAVVGDLDGAYLPLAELPLIVIVVHVPVLPFPPVRLLAFLGNETPTGPRSRYAYYFQDSFAPVALSVHHCCLKHLMLLP